MKTLNIVVLTIMAIFSTNSFAGELYSYSESTIKNDFIKRDAINYLAEYGVEKERIVVSNIKRVEKSTKNVRVGRVDSYLFTADVEVKRYGLMKGLFYVYTGAGVNVKIDQGEVYMATVGNSEQMSGYEKYFIKYKNYVLKDAAATKVALELAINM